VVEEGEQKMAHPGGRPLKFSSPEELQAKIDAYFESCWDEVIVRGPKGAIMTVNQETGQEEPLKEKVQIRPYTITGLAVALDTSRTVLLDYEDKDEFSNTIKNAKNKIETFAEEQLYQLKNPAGAIFNLTNNYHRWTNKQSQEISGPNGGPVQTQAIDFDPSKFTDNELEKIKGALDVMKGKQDDNRN
jgi:hypothetical protein